MDEFGLEEEEEHDIEVMDINSDLDKRMAIFLTQTMIGPKIVKSLISA